MIIERNSVLTCTLSDLEVGDTFESRGQMWLLLDEGENTDDVLVFMVFNLDANCMEKLYDIDVIKRNARLIVEV